MKPLIKPLNKKQQIASVPFADMMRLVAINNQLFDGNHEAELVPNEKGYLKKAGNNVIDFNKAISQAFPDPVIKHNLMARFSCLGVILMSKEHKEWKKTDQVTRQQAASEDIHPAVFLVAAKMALTPKGFHPKKFKKNINQVLSLFDEEGNLTIAEESLKLVA